ncbi:D-xylose-proton symporter-like 2 [Selaginella moellendorffii]|uniref:D-xylose-proton symporter-like 2 n=1 Tax=Selaginella moellendorffii TaxID=88036 RepID=UPI000D1CEF35|nr:D-xylose-proton symporter-like 2 [Selaginella moellendorffii]|eukprot:XP_002992213.2 D-xylose-proton symporter-like 2 [Selaginella moellendorffii]
MAAFSPPPRLLLLKPLSLSNGSTRVAPPPPSLVASWRSSLLKSRNQVTRNSMDMEQPLVDGDAPPDRFKETNWRAVILPFLFPALGGLLFGYDIGATSGASISLTSPELSGTDWYQLTSIQTGLVVSGSLYGALLGSILAYNVADRLGRRKELISAAAIYCIGSLVTGLAPNFPVILAGRLAFGFGIGLAMHGAPMYISETSPSKVRGTLVSLKEAFIVLGILLGYLAGSVEISTVGGWRWMYAFAAPIAIIMGIGMWWLPPSPRWLLLRAVQGKGDMSELTRQACEAFKRLGGGSSNITQEAVDLQVDETVKSLESLSRESESAQQSVWELFRGGNLKTLTIGTGLVFFQQVTGQPSVLYYAATILQSAGFAAATDATRVSVLLGVFKLVMTGVAVFNVDKLGRRPLLIGGVSGIVVSLFMLAAFFVFGKGLSFLAVIALLLYVGCYQISFGPISWLMISEIFPLRTRGRALSISTLVNFAANALVALAYSPLQELLGAPLTFVGFGVIGIVALVFIVSTVPETKGLSLEEIEQQLFASKHL